MCYRIDSIDERLECDPPFTARDSDLHCMRKSDEWPGLLSLVRKSHLTTTDATVAHCGHVHVVSSAKLAILTAVRDIAAVVVGVRVQ